MVQLLHGVKLLDVINAGHANNNDLNRYRFKITSFVFLKVSHGLE
jgi:hypothetical protein